MADRAAAIEELRRYLVRRRRRGLDIIHRLAPPEGEASAVRKETKLWRDPSMDRIPREAAEAREHMHAVIRDEGHERKGTPVSKRNGVDTAGRRTIEVGAQSIRYRHESQPSSQANLFSEKGPAETTDVSVLDLATLEEMVSTCTRCQLGGTRNRTVFGAGAHDARIVFIGEAPGRDEDLQGLPFVGRAGKLLTKILDSVGMSRDEVYITNILKCRPPENRDPLEDEVGACSIFLQRQIELIDPVLICALGRVAGQNLLRSTASLSALRQNVHFYNDIKVIVMYHPAALLRNPNLKRAAWEDIQMVRGMYDEALGNG